MATFPLLVAVDANPQQRSLHKILYFAKNSKSLNFFTLHFVCCVVLSPLFLVRFWHRVQRNISSSSRDTSTALPLVPLSRARR